MSFTFLAVSSGSAAASPWTLRRLPPKPLEEGSDSAGLSGVSCPSESLCVAVGGLDTVAFSQSPSGGADRWHAVYPTYDEPKQSCLEKGEPVSFCSSPRGSLNAVSCAGENLCVAVGYEGSVYVATEPTRRHRVRARFHFYSHDGARGFVCKRDRGKWRPCRSPLRYWAPIGRHILRVRAIGPTGLRGPAASLCFAVLNPGTSRNGRTCPRRH